MAKRLIGRRLRRRLCSGAAWSTWPRLSRRRSPCSEPRSNDCACARSPHSCKSTTTCASNLTTTSAAAWRHRVARNRLQRFIFTLYTSWLEKIRRKLQEVGIFWETLRIFYTVLTRQLQIFDGVFKIFIFPLKFFKIRVFSPKFCIFGQRFPTTRKFSDKFPTAQNLRGGGELPLSSALAAMMSLCIWQVIVIYSFRRLQPVEVFQR